MFSNISPRLKKRVLSALIVMPVVVWMIASDGLPFVFLILACTALAAYEWCQLSLKSKHKFFFLIAGFVYIVIAFKSCYLIRTHHGIENALAFIIMVWASDIGAYITGKTFGGAKMAPNISPNKTWSGFAGALIFPALSLLAFVLIWNFYTQGSDLPAPVFYVFFLVLGVIIGFVCQAGDLAISWFKRHVQVKDAGDFMPGHGGLLDRVDSLMLAAPVYLGIIHFMSKFVVS